MSKPPDIIKILSNKKYRYKILELGHRIQYLNLELDGKHQIQCLKDPSEPFIYMQASSAEWYFNKGPEPVEKDEK